MWADLDERSRLCPVAHGWIGGRNAWRIGSRSAGRVRSWSRPVRLEACRPMTLGKCTTARGRSASRCCVSDGDSLRARRPARRLTEPAGKGTEGDGPPPAVGRGSARPMRRAGRVRSGRWMRSEGGRVGDRIGSDGATERVDRGARLWRRKRGLRLGWRVGWRAAERRRVLGRSG